VILNEFSDLWRYITQQRPGVITVQDRHELEYVFNLIQGCDSYLEVGTAEGNSLYVLAHALNLQAPITYVDYGEKHTTPHRAKIVQELVYKGHTIDEVLGDSNDPLTARRADGKYDVVLIDAGHSYDNVVKDAALYGPMAKKYILFHDIQLPDVERAAMEYVATRPDCKVSRVINSPTFGYLIMEIQ
jgi:predicted O-methyltransferase YrrM